MVTCSREQGCTAPLEAPAGLRTTARHRSGTGPLVSEHPLSTDNGRSDRPEGTKPHACRYALSQDCSPFATAARVKRKGRYVNLLEQVSQNVRQMRLIPIACCERRSRIVADADAFHSPLGMRPSHDGAFALTVPVTLIPVNCLLENAGSAKVKAAAGLPPTVMRRRAKALGSCELLAAYQNCFRSFQPERVVSTLPITAEGAVQGYAVASPGELCRD